MDVGSNGRIVRFFEGYSKSQTRFRGVTAAPVPFRPDRFGNACSGMIGRAASDPWDQGPVGHFDMTFDGTNRSLAQLRLARINGHRGVLEISECRLPAGEPGLPPSSLGWAQRPCSDSGVNDAGRVSAMCSHSKCDKAAIAPGGFAIAIGPAPRVVAAFINGVSECRGRDQAAQYDRDQEDEGSARSMHT